MLPKWALICDAQALMSDKVNYVLCLDTVTAPQLEDKLQAAGAEVRPGHHDWAKPVAPIASFGMLLPVFPDPLWVAKVCALYCSLHTMYFYNPPASAPVLLDPLLFG